MKSLEGARLMSGPDILHGWDWYAEKIAIVRAAPPGAVVLDVGCKEGSWSNDASPYVPAGTLRIGVDPSNHSPYKNLDVYHCCAIDDVECGSRTFYTYSDEGCNSLLQKSAHLNRQQVGSTNVTVTNLEDLLLRHVKAGTTVHYLKCDCQGKDADVVKSLRSFLPHTNYVQIECSFSRERPFYLGQPFYEDDVATMATLGLKPLYYIIYPDSPLPEGEILFGRAI